MKKGLLGWVLSAVFVMAVIAITYRVGFFRRIVIGDTAQS